MKIDFDHRSGHILYDQELTNLFEEEKLVKLKHNLETIKALNPSFTKDGDKYCYLYGNLPNDCVIGFGDTAYLAMIDFVKNFHESKAVNL